MKTSKPSSVVIPEDSSSGSHTCRRIKGSVRVELNKVDLGRSSSSEDVLLGSTAFVGSSIEPFHSFVPNLIGNDRWVGNTRAGVWVKNTMIPIIPDMPNGE